MNQLKYIAVVDDHTQYRKGLCTLIGLFPNYKVILDAANGKDLIRQLNPMQLPDIILLDIVMPEMDGYMLAAWLSANYPEIKVIALSAMESEASIIRMIHAGAKGYLPKDAEPSRIRQEFEEVLSGGNSPELVSRLTGQELSLLKLICTEMTDHELPGEIQPLFAKLKLSSRVELILFAVRNGIATI